MRQLIKSSLRRYLLGFVTISLSLAYAHDTYNSDHATASLEQDKPTEQVDSLSLCIQSDKTPKQDDSRSIYGEVQKMQHHIPRQDWPIKNDAHEILVVDNPLSDKRILPYSTPVPNSSTINTISLIASAGEYEPGSFVLRAGTHKLSNVTVSSSDLVSSDNKVTISATNIDIRVVKPWYQSAQTLNRAQPGQTKQFVPELLLHDDDLVHVDHQRHVNMIRTKPGIRDALSVIPFSVNACTNKQVWLTAKVPQDAESGHYAGTISITMEIDGKQVQDHVKLKIEVLPIHLLEPQHKIGIFYLGWLTKPKVTNYTGRSKTTRQMNEEFIDMKEHGVEIVGLDHSYNVDKRSKDVMTAFESYTETAQMLLDSGHSDNVLVYLDWKVKESDSPDRYKKKIEALSKLSRSLGFKKLWIYNQDEKNYNKLISQRHTFETAHAFNADNIVAVTRANIAQRLEGLLDVAVIKHDTPIDIISSLKSAGITPLAYGVPHASEERPETTRSTYGFKMARKGFSGVFSYAYQSGYCWDDWGKWGTQKYRPSVMAYPTMDKPIPTLQWEGWREAVDDLRYLATYLKRTTGHPDGEWPNWLMISADVDSPDVTRQKIIQKLRDI